MFPLLRLRKNASHKGTTQRMPARGRPRPRFRALLEPLEDRLAPADLTWTGQVSELWSDARNWAEGTTPYATPEADALVFPRTGARRVSDHDGPATTIARIAFEDSGYTIRGGDLALVDVGEILSYAPGGTNTIENRTLAISIGLSDVGFGVDANNDLRVSATISGGRGIFLGGEGKLTLLGNNSYVGQTEVDLFSTLVVGSSTAL